MSTPRKTVGGALIGALLKPFVATAMLLAMSSVMATPTVIYTGGYATGIDDLVVGGTTYDVRFVSGIYDSVYATVAPTFLGQSATAHQAGLAIVALMQAQPVMPLLNGATLNGAALGVLNIPFDATATTFSAWDPGYYKNSYANWLEYAQVVGDSRTRDMSVYGEEFAVFTVDAGPVGAVPEPASWALMLSGLGLFGFMAKRKRG